MLSLGRPWQARAQAEAQVRKLLGHWPPCQTVGNAGRDLDLGDIKFLLESTLLRVDKLQARLTSPRREAGEEMGEGSG